jgi:hypothetical protein
VIGHYECHLSESSGVPDSSYNKIFQVDGEGHEHISSKKALAPVCKHSAYKHSGANVRPSAKLDFACGRRLNSSPAAL